ncbi:MAG: BON domain-containing protein [Gammaproteobacteria bacterium]|nr:BON domain-containing protein [Gammaproteobacteria bacterium]
MGKHAIVLAAVLAFAGLGLAGCNNNDAGTAPGQQMKEGAQQIGQGLANAGDKVADYASDAAITTHVKARLAANQGLSSFNIHVETVDGVVTLTGTVDLPSQRELAGKVATNTDGVKSVNNRIEVNQ